jgi:ribosome-binding ATPase YchF (GTP1/OBG family)
MAKKANDNLKKGRLSNKDFETFKKNIHMSDEQLAKKLKRSVSFIEKTRKRVFPNKKTGKWSKVDVEMLKDNMDNMSVEELARLLNRTESAVETKLKSVKPVEETIEVVETEVEAEPVVEEKAEEKPDNFVDRPGADGLEEEVFPEEEIPADCCGQDCCEHEEKVEEYKAENDPWYVRLWRAIVNFFKVW